MISLRELHEKDAPFMIEWMHDPDNQRWFKKDMLGTSIENVKSFCLSSKIPKLIKNGDNLHFAIVDESDEYLGTVSLKSIDFDNMTAEYAIATRKKARGRGVATVATYEVLKKAFIDYELNRVYLNVFSNNVPAIKLYERCGFKFEGEFREHLRINGKFVNWKWYGILAKEFCQSDSLY